ncbi:hypothetical protein GCM10011512_24940 [Tersicoccus solisilvae]|uniref:ABC transporter permease n=1 Tax=Tersicoccus solisilvae TaxID=1882339 RepID=A0ABQ1PGH6_9MICC|nr:ABC transporter permease [Tersicoccus solisilvae]GGC96918.1 hypothetical protein GCM10011512_24940 [Tersicoccus solisilvae]
MTTTAPAHPAPFRSPSTSGSRIGSVVRLHFANPMTVVVIPAIVLGGIFLVNLAIWWIILRSVPAEAQADAREGLQWSGATFYLFVYMLIVAVQAMNATFAFAQGFGATRRDYYLGTSLVFVVLSLGWSVAFTVMGLLETATGGWGLGGRMFTAIYFTENPLSRLLIVFLAFLFFFFIGAAIATVFVRWRGTGLTLFLVGAAVVLVGIAALVTLGDGWPAVGAWFAAAGPTGVALWSLVITLLAAVAGFLNLRRATTRD